MSRVKPRTLSGFLELLPKEQMQMEALMETLRQSYSLFGFTPLDTPIIESAEVLLAKGGGETEKQIYRFEKGDADLALRFDLTVPLAKYVALHYNELTFPFRRYQIGKVYRGERPQRGRFREFYQADIDIIGDGTLDIASDAEIPAIIHSVFTKFGLKRFVIKINNRKILKGFFDSLGLSGQNDAILRAIDKMDKIGKDKTLGLLLQEKIEEKTAKTIMDFVCFEGKNHEKLEFLSTFRGKNDDFDTGFSQLSAVISLLPSYGIDENNCQIDLKITRGLDYYTGTVYETFIEGHEDIGSICSGGRYDNLADFYTSKPLPGVGISIGLSRLFYILNEQGFLSKGTLTSPCDALIIPMTEDLSVAARTATALRARGLRTSVYGENRKFKAKIAYGDKIGAPFVIFIGQEEIEKNIITLKNMESGEQSALPAEEAAKIIEAEIARLKGIPPITQE